MDMLDHVWKPWISEMRIEPCMKRGVSRAVGCRVMTESFGHIWEIAQQKKLPLRTAAFVKALQSVTRAHLHRGFD